MFDKRPSNVIEVLDKLAERYRSDHPRADMPGTRPYRIPDCLTTHRFRTNILGMWLTKKYLDRHPDCSGGLWHHRIADFCYLHDWLYWLSAQECKDQQGGFTVRQGAGEITVCYEDGFCRTISKDEADYWLGWSIQLRGLTIADTWLERAWWRSKAWSYYAVCKYIGARIGYGREWQR